MATNLATPAASTSAAPSFSGMGLSDAIDSINPVTPDAPETPEVQQPDAAQPEAPVETQPEQAQPEPVAEPEAEIGDFDDIAADREADGGKTLHFSRTKANALLAARDFRRRLMENVPNASVEDHIDNYRRTVELDRMLTDYESGDPERVGGVLDTWLNPQANPQTLMAFADHAPAKLAQSNPQAFQKLESNILGNWVNNLYQSALRSNDQRLLEIAQNVDFQMNGRFRQANELQQQQPNPQAAQSRQFQLERQRWQQERGQWVQQQVSQAQEAVDNARRAEILKPLQTKGPDGKTIEERISALPGGSELKEFAVNRLQAKLDEAIAANPAWKAQYDLALQRFRDNPSDKGRAEVLVNMMRQFAAPVIARNSKAVLDALTGNFLGKNAETHQKLQQAAQRNEPLNGGNPVQRATTQQKLAEIKKRGGSLEEGFAALGI